MKKANVEKLQTMAEGFLQYRWRIHLMTKKMEEEGKLERLANTESPDFTYYKGACAMIEAFGGHWRRYYKGDHTPEAMNNINNYSHSVWFPSDETCAHMNEHAWD